jgi:hypothetical protein
MNRLKTAGVSTLLPILALAPGAAAAQSYSGHWPVDVALPAHFAHTACLALVDTGTSGQHGGSASLSGPMVGDRTETGTFQVINGLLVASFAGGSDNGELTYALFIAPASDGELQPGAYEQPGYLSGALGFGNRGGC